MTASKKPGQPGNIIALDDWGQKEIITLSSGSTAPVVLKSDQSGAFVVIPGMTSGMTITLPAPAAGLEFEFYVKAATTSGVIKIAAPTTGTMVIKGDAAADALNIGKAAGAAVIGGAIRFVSDGTLWYSIMEPAFSSAAPTSLTMTEYGTIS